MSSFGQVGKGIDEFGKNVVGSALGGVGIGLDEFGKHLPGPALEITSDRYPQGEALLRWEQRGRMLTTFPDTDEGVAMTVLGDVATACAFGAHRSAVIKGVGMSI